MHATFFGDDEVDRDIFWVSPMGGIFSSTSNL